MVVGGGGVGWCCGLVGVGGVCGWWCGFGLGVLAGGGVVLCSLTCGVLLAGSASLTGSASVAPVAPIGGVGLGAATISSSSLGGACVGFGSPRWFSCGAFLDGGVGLFGGFRLLCVGSFGGLLSGLGSFLLGSSLGEEVLDTCLGAGGHLDCCCSGLVGSLCCTWLLGWCALFPGVGSCVTPLESSLFPIGLGIFSVAPVLAVGLSGFSSRCSLTFCGSCSGYCCLLWWLRTGLVGNFCVALPVSLFLPVGPGISCVVPVLSVGLVGGSCGYSLATCGYS